MNASPSEATLQSLARWHVAKKRLADSKQELSYAETELRSAETALGKHLCPKDATLDETFNLWVGQDLLVVTNTGSNNYKIQFRK